MNKRTQEKHSVSPGLARTVGQMTEAAALKWSGSNADMELIKGDTYFQASLFKYWDKKVRKIRLSFAKKLPTWATVRVGCRNYQRLKWGVEEKGYAFVEDFVNTLEITHEEKERDIELVLVNNYLLGLEDQTTWQHFLDQAIIRGFLKCPQETVLQLLDQVPMKYIAEEIPSFPGCSLVVVSEPFVDTSLGQSLLCIQQNENGEFRVKDYPISELSEVEYSDTFVFTRRPRIS